MKEYYAIPIKLYQLISGKKLETVEVRKAVHQNIRFIIKSYTLSYKFDPNFGCMLNKFHARTPPQNKSERAWRDKIREDLQKNLKSILSEYESRITISDVFVELKDPTIQEKKSLLKVKVEVKGQFNLGRKEKFYYPDSEIDEDAKEIFPLVIPCGKGQ